MHHRVLINSNRSLHEAVLAWVIIEDEPLGPQADSQMLATTTYKGKVLVSCRGTYCINICTVYVYMIYYDILIL